MRKATVLFLVLISILALGCLKEEPILTEGDWWGYLKVSETEKLPFNFTLSKIGNEKFQMEIFNAEETVVVDEITYSNDTILIQMPVFEGYIKGTFSSGQITGDFIKESLDRVVPFHAFYGARDRFLTEEVSKESVTGVWETYFEPGTEDEYVAKGIFSQNGEKVTGTFRTKTGDYRYLEGIMDGDSLKLSTFDGAHAFLFTAKITADSLKGIFYSGNHSVEKFMAKRNEAFELPDANSLTYLKEGYDSFDFTFPNSEGTMVSLNDEQFENKPVIVQIMGSWCPNCLDETKFYVDYISKNPDLDVQFIGLAFEYAKTEERAWKSIQRLKKRVGVQYPILLAQYGTSNKKKANEKLPMLNHVLSYPTTIFITKEGEVHKIHTGFNGPATGDKYDEFVSEFQKTIERLTQGDTII